MACRAVVANVEDDSANLADHLPPQQRRNRGVYRINCVEVRASHDCDVAEKDHHEATANAGVHHARGRTGNRVHTGSGQSNREHVHLLFRVLRAVF